MEQRAKKRGDRFDGYWLRDEAPALGQFMAYLMPNRADNEAHINMDVDCRPLDAFLAKKNEGLTEDKYTYFHIFLAAAAEMNAAHEECAVIEDSYNGIRAAHNAGMRPLMVPDMLPATEEMQELAEHVFPSLFDVKDFFEQNLI